MLKFVSNNELLLYLMIFFFHSQHYQPRIINYYCKKKFRTLIFSPSLYIDAYNSLAQCRKIGLLLSCSATSLVSIVEVSVYGYLKTFDVCIFPLSETFYIFFFFLQSVRPPSIILLVVQNYILGDDYGYLATTR